MENGQITSQTGIANGYTGKVSVQDLEQGMVNAARLVRRYGSIYWPIVERLQREIDAIEKRDALLERLLGTDAKNADQANFG